MSENPFASPPDDINPYSSPSAEGGPTGNPLVIPAAFLLSLSAIMLLLLLISLPGMIAMYWDLAEIAQEDGGPGISFFAGMFGFLIALFVTHIVMIAGSISMLRLKGFALARVAGVLAVIPFCSAFYVVGIPFGIWALVLLRRPEVKQTFSK